MSGVCDEFCGNCVNKSFSKHSTRWLLILSDLKEVLVWNELSGLKQNSTRLAIANNPQSKPFSCCWESKILIGIEVLLRQ